MNNPLATLRRNAGLTQRQLATRIGVSPPYISKIETGQEQPTDALLINIAPHLNIDPYDLLLEKGRIPEELTKDLHTILNRSPTHRHQLTALLHEWAQNRPPTKGTQ